MKKAKVASLRRAAAEEVESSRGLPSRRDFVPPAARSGFSLIEVMIAIVILGFGLVMVATMYPIAWSRARVMTEQSAQASIVDSAEELVRQVLQVDGGKVKKTATAPSTDRGSFAGDMILTNEDAINGMLYVLCFGDTRVHQLHMENILVAPLSPPRRFFPDRQNPAPSSTLPYRLERTSCSVPIGDEPSFFYGQAFGAAQIRFEDRVVPPLHTRDPNTVNANGHFIGDDAQWDESLDTRRYTFAVFHRQRGFERKYADLPEFGDRIVGPDGYPPSPPTLCDPFQGVAPQVIGEREADYPRNFDFYFVTLRRGQSTYRFAQQDPLRQFTPDPDNRGNPVVEVRALDSDQDVLLPVPWRVQIYIPQPPQGAAIPYRSLSYAPTNLSNPPLATGSPAIVHVNDPLFPTGPPFVVDLFQEGTWFIDEHNGQVYQVANRRIVPGTGGGEQAILTLDREIVVEDIDDDCQCQSPTGMYPGRCIPDHWPAPPSEGTETLRSVWVFPPPVQGRDGGGNPIFEGDSPVVGIEVRTLTFAPRP